MNISTIQIQAEKDGSTKTWRCRKGVGRFQNSLVIRANSDEVEQIANGLAFALLGRKDGKIFEVSLEFNDNSGDTWSVQRGAHGSRFSQNSRPISLDQAQKSMLAALLDMDISLASGDGLVASLVARTIEYRKSVFTSHDALSANPQNQELDAKAVNDMLADECAKVIGIPEYRDPAKLALITDTLVTLQGRWIEAQTTPHSQSATKSAAPSLSMIESLSRELDHLQQIDFLCKKMGDAQENPSRLAGQIETLEQQISQIREKWSPEALALGGDLEKWSQGLELLVRARGYAKLSDTAVRIRRISAERVRPVAEAALSSWDQFLNGSRATGQEVESCLASMLLGMKQLALDLDRIAEAPTQEAPKAKETPMGWFDRLRNTSAREHTNSPTSEPLTIHQKWVAKALREVESIKESLDYSLKAVQNFVDQTSDSKSQSGRGLQLLEELAQKSEGELARLNQAWSGWLQESSIPEDVSIDALCNLACDAAQLQILVLSRDALAQRLDERLALQNALEVLIRQWWQMIGSDKGVDIKNPAFLVAEARAALRHRDTRRQRVQKIVKDAARHARDESLLQWAHKRKMELQTLWQEMFTNAGLPPFDITDARAPVVARLGSAIQAMRQLEILKDEAKWSQTDIWATAVNAAVRVYILKQTSWDEAVRERFLELVAANSTVDESNLCLFLVSNEPLAKELMDKGLGSAIFSEVSTVGSSSPRTRELDSERTVETRSRSGGSSEVRRAQAESPASLGQDTLPATPSRRPKTGLSPKAEAALSLLNPKARHPK